MIWSAVWLRVFVCVYSLCLCVYMYMYMESVSLCEYMSVCLCAYMYVCISVRIYIDEWCGGSRLEPHATRTSSTSVVNLNENDCT